MTNNLVSKTIAGDVIIDLLDVEVVVSGLLA